MSYLDSKIAKAAKWSSITELFAKLITPITSIVLARLLTPEAFGVVTTLTMVITFAEIFTDAGFQKYLIQHEFLDEYDRAQSTNVAFWSNLIMSFFIWLLISIFADPISSLVGSPGLGNVLIISCSSIPMAAFSSIQMALYKRDLDFKTLFKVRMVSVAIPLIITVPLAFILRTYWALIIGTIATNLINAILLTVLSSWKPRFFFSFDKLKEMFSFSAWSVAESITVWLTSYADIFIVSRHLSTHYIGLYKTSIVLVGQIMGLITVATTPILFSSLSRLQNDSDEFNRLFFKFQKIVAFFVIPLGFGIYVYKDFITTIFLGNAWIEAAPFIGQWGLFSSIMIVMAHYSTEIFRAKGLPRLSTFAQLSHLVALVPIVLIFAPKGFESLCTARAWIRLEDILVKLILMSVIIKISPIKMFQNIYIYILASICMASIGIFINKTLEPTLVNNLISVVICASTYILFICLFKRERTLLKEMKSKIKI